jgi:hypothetical protein
MGMTAFPAMAAEEEPVFIDEGIINTENDFSGNPVLMPVTAYIEKGKPTATGNTKACGILAAKEEWLGCTAILYKVADDGRIGDIIGIFPIEDIGYGKSTGYGISDFKGRKSAGDIELGCCIDMRCASYSDCLLFLRSTFVGAEYSRSGSAVYFQLLDAEG